MQYGAYLVYIFFTLLMAFWGRRIAQTDWPFLTKLLVVSAIFVFFALGGEQWQELWILLWELCPKVGDGFLRRHFETA